MIDLLTVSYALLGGLELAGLFVSIPMNIHMLLAATLTVYIGAHFSLIQEEGNTEQLQSSDAIQFPFIAGAALGVLFLAFTYLDAYYVNLVLTTYFVGAGIFCLTSFIEPMVRRVVTSRRHVVSIGHIPWYGPLHATPADLLAVALSAAICGWYAATKHWLGNNAIGIAFCVQAVQKLSLGSYKVAVLLLVGLFVYDIIMVFYTPMMVTVATKLDGPIKLLFGRGYPDPGSPTSKEAFSLLGLGDIVVPGVFIALLLRHDAVRAHAAGLLKNAVGGVVTAATLHAREFPKTFFNAALAAYTAGLVATIGVMFLFDAAQPALLYLVPSCLAASALAAVFVGPGLEGLWQLLEYKDDDYADAFHPPAVGSAAEEADGGAGASASGSRPESEDEASSAPVSTTSEDAGKGPRRRPKRKD